MPEGPRPAARPALPALPALREWVAGAAQTPARTLPDCIDDSSTGEVLAEQRESDDAAIERALAAAEQNHRRRAWAGLDAETRSRMLGDIADAIDAERTRFAALDALTCGVPLDTLEPYAQLSGILFRESAKQIEVLAQPERFEGANATTEVQRAPWGPALLISPWNMPLALACQKVAAALAAGCPVILKPSEWAPHSCQLLADRIAELALPEGTFQLLHGGAACGAALAGDARVQALSFTGGIEGGRAVARASAEFLRPAQLELGGNSALIVCEDADVQEVAEHLAHGLTYLNGQWCRAVGRVLAHQRIADALVQATLARLAELRIDDAMLPGTGMGPLAHGQQRARFRAHLTRLQALGGTLHAPGRLPELGGHFQSPMLATGVDAADAREEIFGPAATVHTFVHDAEAVAIANDSDYGLTQYVFSGDPERAHRIGSQLESGTVKLNAVRALKVSRDAPRPVWKQSGLGEEGTRENVAFFMGRRGVVYGRTGK